MSEEQEQEGTWSSLKKTVVGVLGTVVTAGGVWLTTLLGGGEKEAAPAAAPALWPIQSSGHRWWPPSPDRARPA